MSAFKYYSHLYRTGDTSTKTLNNKLDCECNISPATPIRFTAVAEF